MLTLSISADSHKIIMNSQKSIVKKKAQMRQTATVHKTSQKRRQKNGRKQIQSYTTS